MNTPFASLVGTDDPTLYEITTRAPGPEGRLPLTDRLLRESPSGDIFGWTQDVGMGWRPDALTGQEFLILSTQGGIRGPDGSPSAITPATGKSACSCRRRPTNCAAWAACPSPALSPIPAMAAPRARPA